MIPACDAAHPACTRLAISQRDYDKVRKIILDRYVSFHEVIEVEAERPTLDANTRVTLEFLDAKGLDGLLLGRSESFAWFTGGGDCFVKLGLGGRFPAQGHATAGAVARINAPAAFAVLATHAPTA